MKVCVIGGSGFLSGTVVREALAAGHDVSVVTRGKRAVPDGVRALIADRHDVVAFAAALRDAGDFDLVVDCICFNAADAQQDVDVLAGRTKKLVMISTDFVYASEGRPFPVTEAFDRFETVLPYGANKRAAEETFFASVNRLPSVILRPCHIYGPGSQLGCLPSHGRDPQLIDKLRRGETLTLVGGGHFLQQPVYAPDLAKMALSAAATDRAVGGVYHAAGPEVVESRDYYRIVADHLGVKATFDETRVVDYLAAHPEHRPFCCHRVYDMTTAKAAGLAVPSTPLREGLGVHAESLMRG